MKIKILALSALCAIFAFSCQENESEYAPKTGGDGVVNFFGLTFGSSDLTETSESTETKVALNPSSSVAFTWTENEHLECVDMYYSNYSDEEGVSKSYDMKCTVITSTSSVSSISVDDFPVEGLEEVNGSTGEIALYAFSPSNEFCNTRYEDMIEISDTENDYLKFTYPMNRTFYIDPNATMTESYERYGLYLPFVTVPIITGVEWSGTAETGSIIYSDGYSRVLNFYSMFHTLILKIYPSLEDEVQAIQASEFTTTITIQPYSDGTQYYFKGTEEIDMNKFKKKEGVNTLLTDMVSTAAVGTRDDSKDGAVVSVTTYYVDGDKGDDGIECSPVSRIATSGAEYMSFPVIVPETTGPIRKFDVKIEFKNLDGEVVTTVTKSCSDNTSDPATWCYGDTSEIELKHTSGNFYYDELGADHELNNVEISTSTSIGSSSDE